jgi:Chlamydia polymorphic membrane protein (Chlamydia_PMP) repeat
MKAGITPSIKSTIVAILFFAAVIELRADTITVTNTNDSGPGSLRQALADVNDGDTIDFAVTGKIALTSGELLVDRRIVISGSGANNLGLDGNGMSRVLYIAPRTTAVISGLTISNGNESNGGGVYNDHATLTLTNCVISGNVAASDGGGIFADGSENGRATVTISNSTLNANSALDGGGIYMAGLLNGNAVLTVDSSTLSGNTAEVYGGGIFTAGVNGNFTAQIINSTFNENSASSKGGGIYNFGGPLGTATLQIGNTTFVDNAAQSSGDSIYNVGALGGGGTTILVNTILKTGAAGRNIVNEAGSIQSFGYNLSSDDGSGYLTGPGDQINTDPIIGPLQDNGGPTFTHELLAGSPAIDAGDPAFTPPPFFDQRGPDFFRVRNGRIDIGSFEVQVGSTPTPTPPPTPTPTPRATPTPRSRPTPRHRPTPP